MALRRTEEVTPMRQVPDACCPAAQDSSQQTGWGLDDGWGPGWGAEAIIPKSSAPNPIASENISVNCKYTVLHFYHLPIFHH